MKYMFNFSKQTKAKYNFKNNRNTGLKIFSNKIPLSFGTFETGSSHALVNIYIALNNFGKECYFFAPLFNVAFIINTK